MLFGLGLGKSQGHQLDELLACDFADGSLVAREKEDRARNYSSDRRAYEVRNEYETRNQEDNYRNALGCRHQFLRHHR